MPQKQPLDKQCWEWAEATDSENVTLEHVKTAYRLNLTPCKLGKCRRHCKGNPYCVNCIGERVWFNEIEDTAWHDIQDPEAERRKPGMSVGLKNLGATCYVNTFLQLWYHNETVKQGIFEWKDTKGTEDNDWKPTTVCAHLQVIFGFLEKSIRRYIDPSDFIHHLGLDAGQQQDAQEFSKLFLSVLEQSLADTPTRRNVIKEQFCGSYAYVTRCNHCQSASERMSEFYELDLNIQGHKTLTDALKGFLEMEKLEGDNKYMCSRCNEKQNATRAIELKNLPPVLNLQLLRFVYDLKTGSKKKLNSIIQFPEVLDMSLYLGQNRSAVYELSAVLIHRGPSAYSGHYVAHIRDQESQGWYKFNDEEIEKIKGKSLQLGNEEDLETKQKKMARVPKGFVSSRNAYMLVYTIRMETNTKHAMGNGKIMNNDFIRTGNLDVGACNVSPAGTSKSETLNTVVKESIVAQHSMSVPNFQQPVQVNNSLNYNSNFTENEAKIPAKPEYSLPDYITRFVRNDNESFEKWVEEMKDMKAGNIARGREKQEIVKAIFQDLPYSNEDGEKFEWLPMSWLTKWLNDPSTSPAIEMSGFVCIHGKVGVEQSTKMKCVSPKGSDQLYNMYGGSQRMKGFESLCMDCVRTRCKQIRSKQKISEDDKFISMTMKKNCIEESYYWVGKGSFRSWRRLAMERLLEDVATCKDGKSQSELYMGKCDANDSVDEDEHPETRDEINNITENNIDYSNTITDCDMKPSGSGTEKNSSRKNGSHISSGIEGGKNEDLKDHEVTMSGEQKVKHETADNDVEEEETLQFNEDLLCDNHKGLEPDVSRRRIIPESVWIRLKKYFPDCPEFSMFAPPCEKCLSTIEAEHQDKELNRKIAAAQKAALTDLLFDRKRPLSVSVGSEIYVVSTAFIENWRAFIRDPVKNECVNVLKNSMLLCEHGEFLYPPLEDCLLKSDSKVTYVTKNEWTQLKQFFATDTEISIICLIENDTKQIITFPKVCDGCLHNRFALEEKEIFDYENEIMYVRKNVKLEKGKVKEPVSELNDDPDFSSGTRKRILSDDPADAVEPPEKLKKVTDAGKIVRKSQRHRRVRGEKEICVSSNQTLKDLKICIMKQYSVPPFDQNLYVDGILLTNNDLTLGELKVAPGSVINLIADEAEEDTTFLEDISKHSGMPESGFKGTNLLSGT